MAKYFFTFYLSDKILPNLVTFDKSLDWINNLNRII